jgi:hypothetical protein
VWRNLEWSLLPLRIKQTKIEFRIQEKGIKGSCATEMSLSRDVLRIEQFSIWRGHSK